MAISVMIVLHNIDLSPREIAQRLHCKRCRRPKVSDRQVSSVGAIGLTRRPPADTGGSGSPKVHSGTASARNWVGGSIAGTNLSVADVGAIRAASRELRRYSYPSAKSCAAQSRATCR